MGGHTAPPRICIRLPLECYYPHIFIWLHILHIILHYLFWFWRWRDFQSELLTMVYGWSSTEVDNDVPNLTPLMYTLQEQTLHKGLLIWNQYYSHEYLSRSRYAYFCYHNTELGISSLCRHVVFVIKVLQSNNPKIFKRMCMCERCILCTSVFYYRVDLQINRRYISETMMSKIYFSIGFSQAPLN